LQCGSPGVIVGVRVSFDWKTEKFLDRSIPVRGIDALALDACLQGSGNFQPPERGNDGALIGNPS
jgi:hypothetical protein